MGAPIERQVMKDTLDQYVSETLSSIGTIEYFCKGQEEWAHQRQGEIKSMLDIKSRADQVKFGQVWKAKAKDKFKAMKKCMRSRVTANREELEKELAAVLERSLMGLKELRSFLEAVEKLAVTSPLVFTDWEGNALDICSVIYAAKTVAPLLIQFKRDDAAFFLPNLSIVEVLAAQLDMYINITIQICKKLNGSGCNCDNVINFHTNTNEEYFQKMLNHLNELNLIRKNQDVRLALLFQDDAQSFIGLYRERHTRMREFLSQIEEKATLLNKMKKGGNISSVTSSSVGVVGGIVSIVGLALAPVTAGVSLSLTISVIGLGLSSGTTALVTGITKTTVKTHHGKNADKLFKRFEEDASELTKCLETASTIKTPHVQPDIGYLLAKSVQTQVKAGLLGKSIHGLQTSVKVARALRNGKVAKDVAKRTPLAMSKFARGGLIGLNVVFVLWDISSIYSNSKSLAKGEESDLAQIIGARVVLCRSELDSWERIHDSLCRGISSAERSQEILNRPFYPAD